MEATPISVDLCTKFLKCLTDGPKARKDLREGLDVGFWMVDRMMQAGTLLNAIEKTSEGFRYIKAIDPRDLSEATRNILPYPSSLKSPKSSARPLKRASTRKPATRAADIPSKAVVPLAAAPVPATAQRSDGKTRLKILIIECDPEQAKELLAAL